MTNEQSFEQLFEQLLSSWHPCIGLFTHEEGYARQMVANVAVNTTRDMFFWSITEGLRDGIVSGSEPFKETSHPAAAMMYLNRMDRADMMVVAYDLVEHLDDSRTLRVLRDLLLQFEKTGSTLILIDHNDDIPKILQSYITRYEIALPDEEELGVIVRRTLHHFNREKPIQIDITRTGLETIIRNLRGLSRRQAQQIIYDTVAEDRCFNNDDIASVMVHKRQMLKTDGQLEYIETPAELSEIGGMDNLKAWLSQRRYAMTTKAEEYGIDTPKGVLMLGIQGAGKSLCAKAIATAWQFPLFRLDPSRLYDQYIGQSEKRLRQSLRQAEIMAPIILWIDEIEKAFASAASKSSDGGLSQRMFGTLLTWMQERSHSVFLVATANDIEALPPELLRKGRFDEIFFVGLPDKATRKDIFAIHLRKRKRDENEYDLDKLAEVADGYSGAEIEQAIISAVHVAYAAQKTLTSKMIQEAVINSPPLSRAMAEKVDALNAWAKGRCVPA